MSASLFEVTSPGFVRTVVALLNSRARSCGIEIQFNSVVSGRNDLLSDISVLSGTKKINCHSGISAVQQFDKLRASSGKLAGLRKCDLII